MRLTAAGDDDQRRVDRILRKALPGMPLSALHRLFRKGRITVDGVPAGPSARVRAGQVLEIAGIMPDSFQSRAAPSPPPGACRLPPLAPLFEDSGLLILNKAPGVLVHGPDSLEGQVRAYLEPKTPLSLSFKPGPLHRLDKPTSGVIVFSASLEGARVFSALLRDGKIRKEYLAVVDGILEAGETWEDCLGRDEKTRTTFSGEKTGEGEGRGKAKSALTRVRPLARAGGRTLLLAEISTGRTHQIRAQAAARGHPLCGDGKYGGKPFPQGGRKGPGAFFLHALALQFPEPPAGDAGFPARVEAPLPEDFALAVKRVFGYGYTGPGADDCV